MTIRNVIFLLSILCLFSCTRVPTKQQASKKQYGDEELKKFASIYNYLRLRPRDNAEMAVRDAVHNSTLSEKRFGEIMRAKFTQQKITTTPEEDKALAGIRSAVQATQMDQKKENDKIIIKRGMTLERYYTILRTYKQSTFLQNRIYDLLHTEKK